MTIWKKILQAPIWRQSAMAGLLCTMIVLLNILCGLVAEQLFYSFWLSVFLFGFTPMWIICYGLIFATRWKWHEMSLGVFVSIFLTIYIYNHSLDDTNYLLLFSTGCALFAVLSMTLGFLTTRIILSLSRDIIRALSSKSNNTNKKAGL